jgi:putative transposase
MGDRVHIFVEVPPRYSPSQAMQILKNVSARRVFKKFPKLRKQLWAREFWSDGYFVMSVDDKVTTEIIRRYIEYQTHAENSSQLLMLEKP